MSKVLLSMAFALAALSIASVAGARGPDNEFATGSAKSDIAVVGLEHVRFSAHNLPPTSTNACPATGQIHYSTPSLTLKLDVTHLVVAANFASTEGGRAFMGAVVTETSNPTLVAEGSQAWLDVVDSGMNPAGTGDQVRFQPNVSIFCFTPIPGHPIDQGNVIVKVAD